MSTRTRITYFVIALVLLAVLFPIGYVLAQDSTGGNGKIFLPVIANRAGPQENALTRTALGILSTRYGVPVSDLVVDVSAQSEYRNLGMTTTVFKVHNAVNGEAYGVELNQAGEEVNSEASWAADAQAYADRYGKIEPALADALAAAGDRSVPVIIALNSPDGGATRPDISSGLTEDQYRAIRGEAMAAQEAAVDAVTAPFAAKLDSMGIKVETNKQLAYAYGSLTQNEANAVSQMPEVRSIGLDVQNVNDLAFTWSRTAYSSVYSRRVIGRGVKLAINEVGHGVPSANSLLRLVYSDTTTRCTSVASHETGVAGIIYSSDLTYTGMAMGSQLGEFGSCGGWSSELSSAASRAVSWGADGINNSWGASSPSRLITVSNEGFYDNLWWNTWTTIVKSAGNNGLTNGYISNPASYNIIHVGAEDKNPYQIANFSSWVNPDTRADDMEKPEVTAPGRDMISTLPTSGSGNIGSGTSFSAPVVNAEVADIIQRNYALGAWPEAIKAIIMATAARDIPGTNYSREGAGGVHFFAADNIMNGTKGSYGTGSISCASAFPITLANVSIPNGQKVRFAVTWDADSAYASYTSRPGADLDLRVYIGATQVAASASFDRTNEYVTFTNTSGVTNTYTFKLVKFDCFYTPHYFGWAYYRYI